jgi:hypothetical protein
LPLQGYDFLTTKPGETNTDWPLFCARCAAELQPGSGNLFIVKIEAVADPSPPDISDEDLEGDLQGKIKELIAQMDQMSASEAMDQVYRRLTLYLCGPCYRHWIENPTGS